MVNKYLKHTLLCAGTLALCASARAQAPGSESIYGGVAATKSVLSGGTSSDISESLYIGPGTHQIDGTWEIYARYVIIDPSAVISGSGVLRLLNPSVAGGSASTTLLDGNNGSSPIDVAVELANNAGMQLQNRAFPLSLSTASWTDDAGASSLYLGQDLNLSVDGADVQLGSGVVGDLKLSATAGISNYRPQRMVITNNSILSHLVKENYSSAFVFPVGIADGDYTPVQISNAASNTIRVSVQDYAASTPDEATADPGPGGIPADGMNRSWHIYADNTGISSSLNLQHNNTSNQSGFTDANQFVTQWSSSVPNTSGDVSVPFSTSAWQSNTPGAGATGTLLTGAASLAGSSMRSRSYSSLPGSATAPESYFTKSSDPLHPLPVQILSFSAQSNKCTVAIDWKSSDSKDIDTYVLEYSADGKDFRQIAVVRPEEQRNEYQYLHTDLASGKHYYRLHLLADGKSAGYTQTRMASVSCALEQRMPRVYPNPSTDLIVVDDLEAQKSYTLRLLAADGKLLLERQSSAVKEELRIGELPQGNYLLQIIPQNETPINIRVQKF